MQSILQQRTLFRFCLFIISISLLLTSCSFIDIPASKSEPALSLQQLNENHVTIHFIDVGQGGAQLLIGPSGKTMLIDAGNNDKEQLIVQYLQAEKIKKIDVLIGTHPDADHIGGLDAVIDHFEIGEIYMPKIQANTKTFEDVLLAIKRKKLTINTAKHGVAIDWEPQVATKLLAPLQTYKDTNEMSAVLQVVYNQHRFLLTGDIEAKSEADLLASGEKLTADVLLVSHHGSNTSTSAPFLQAVKPTYAIIQSGKDNKYGHPNHDILKRLKQANVSVFRNDRDGHIVISSDGENFHIATGVTPGTYSLPTAAMSSSDLIESMQIAATIDNDQPAQNSIITITAQATDQQDQPIVNAIAELTLHYKTTTSTYEATTDENGQAVFQVRIGGAAKDFAVKGYVHVTHQQLQNEATVQFTPQ
ncbi:ComEC/Rec2 family competence protein [Paenibacillus yanchengensis]|uniref:ComEC/Rec2 family competence protein n=1 Tax=Paenibacillus yanchengensis TaxID=2035833 RepID=A0ABW4YJB7_9BACL